MKILVVDDQLSNRAVITRFLLSMDIQEREIVQRWDGVSAFQAFTEQEFDLVITDNDMPHMSGIELAEAIRAYSERPNTPIIMMSGAWSAENSKRASGAGVVEQLTKPLSRERLAVFVNKLLMK